MLGPVGGMGPRKFYGYTYNQKHLLFSIHPMEIEYEAYNVTYAAQTMLARATPYPDEYDVLKYFPDFSILYYRFLNLFV